MLKSIFWAVSSNEGTHYVVHYNELCAPPKLPRRANLELRPSDLVPAGFVLAMIEGDTRRDDVRIVRGIRFGEFEAEVEFIDRDMPAAEGRRPLSAITLPYDEMNADDLDQLKYHAGVLVGQALARWGQS